MNANPNDGDWAAATWEGSRLAQLRRSLELTVRERLEALEALAITSAQLARLAERPPRGGSGSK